MLSTVILTSVIIMLIGLVIKVIYDHTYTYDHLRITWVEFVIVSVICSFITTPLVVYLGWEIGKRSKLIYKEYYNGWETNTQIENTKCHKNGPCRYTYDCDPHLVSYSCNCHQSCSGSGNYRSCTESCETCTRIEYDDCPYVDYEYDYIVNTTLGDYTIDSHRFPENPQNHRWRESEDIPDRVIEKAGVGAPDFWKLVDKRIREGKPGPVTQVNSYKNLIYATEKNIYKQYSSMVESYKKAGLLPRLSVGVRDFYMADKVYWVGFKSSDANMWNERLSYLNAAVGSELQGDIHLIIADSSKITNPDEFILTVRAYWENPLEFGRNSLSKNAIVIALGTDGKTVTWARGFTGMPVGNSEVIQALFNLKGTTFTVENILGNVQRVSTKGGFQTVHSLGLIENILYGFKDKSIKFKRVSMEKKDNWDVGTGFQYLFHEVQPSTATKVWCVIISIVIACAGWMMMVFTDVNLNISILKRR